MLGKKEARWRVINLPNGSGGFNFTYHPTMELSIPITLHDGNDKNKEKDEILDSLLRKQNVPDSYPQVRDVISFILSQELSNFQRKTIAFTYTSCPNASDHIDMCVCFKSRQEFLRKLVEILERTTEIGDMLIVKKQ